MPNEEKLSKFLQAIHSDAEQRREAILRETEDFKTSELEKAEKEALSEAYELIHNEIGLARAAISRELSVKELDSKRELLRHRRRLMDEIFAQAGERLNAFAGSDGYLPFLERCVAETAGIFAGGEVALFVRRADLKYEQQLKAAFGRDCSVRGSNDITLGGVRAVNRDCGQIADNSIDSRLEAQKDWFFENSGLALTLSGEN